MKQQKDFYPDYLVEILFVVFLTVELVTILSLLYPQSVGLQINFSAPYRPKPEWYFLWLYQVIKYFPGKSIVVGTVVLPMIGIWVFVLMPFVDKGRWGRIKAVIAGTILLVTFLFLTTLSVINP